MKIFRQFEGDDVKIENSVRSMNRGRFWSYLEIVREYVLCLISSGPILRVNDQIRCCKIQQFVLMFESERILAAVEKSGGIWT